MNILHVLPDLGRGGGERLAIELANGQAEAGHRVTMLLGYRLPQGEGHDPPDPRVEVRTMADHRPGRLGKYAAMIRWLRRNRELIAAQDLLHCHLTFGAIFGSFVRRMSRRPAIVETYHAVGMPIPRIQRWAHARLASQWDGISFMVGDPYWEKFTRVHREIVSRLIPVGVASPPPVSGAEQSRYREELGIASDALVVGTIGRLVEERRARRYVPAFARIARQVGDRVHFVMGGDGPERERIRRDAQSLGIAGKLHLPGLVRRVELPLSVFDLYVTANVGPVCGVAGLQAVAAGLPVIALQLNPGHAGDGDWIWSTSDPVELGDRAAELLASREQRRELAERQRAYLEANHSPAAMVRNFEAFYRDAIAARRR